MKSANRAERVPQWLFGIDSLLCLAFVPLTVFTGPVPIVLAYSFVILTYSLGGFDVLSLTRHYAQNAPWVALVFIGAVQIVIAVGEPGVWNVATAAAGGGGYLCLATFHVLIRNLFVSGVQNVDLIFPRHMTNVAALTAHYVEVSGYPAEVSLNTNGDPNPVAIIKDAKRIDAGPSEPYLANFDPLRFFDTALRLLPPEMAEDRLATARPLTASKRLYLGVKRLFDILLAAAALIVSLPLWLFATVGILIADGRPVFFRQDRLGSGGTFRMAKFRTLRNATESPVAGARDVADRSFAFGRLLRRLRIDELPQLLMILRGTMSFVGPRPEMAFFHERSVATIPCYEQRLLAKPGLTGWAQIRFHHTTTEDEYRDKTAYDLWYVVHRGLFLDFKILLRTIGTLTNLFGSR